MTRVHHGRAPSRDRQRSVRKKKDFKIVLEAVTERKRKLHTVATYIDRPPKDYGFVPVGFGEFTDWCKEQCRQRGRDVHIVSAAPHNRSHADPNKLSSHVHRIGYHFPLDVIEPACQLLRYKFSQERGLEKLPDVPVYGDAYFERRFADYYERARNSLHGQPAEIREDKNYIRGAIREMFPKIPDPDLESIVNHAFESGTNRVGNAKELTLARRVQLAVLAHIRHQYTEYDNLLGRGKGSWALARKAVEQTSVAKLIEWRDEQGGPTEELEEVFREIIVIDDDEDDNSSNDSQSQDPDVDEREVSVEVVSSLATARDLQPTSAEHSQGPVPYSYRPTRRTIYLPPRPVAPYPGASGSSAVYRTPQRPRNGNHITTLPPPAYMGSRRLIHPRPLEPTTREPVRVPRPLEMRGSDGQLYTLQPIERQNDIRSGYIEMPLLSPYRSRPSSPSYQSLEPLRSRPVELSHSGRPMLTPASRRASDQDVVLPSVEQDSARGPSPRYSLDSSHDSRFDRTRVPLSHASAQLPKRKSLPGPPTLYTYGTEPHLKRQRPVEDERRHVGHVIDQSNASRRSMFGSATANTRSFPQQEVSDLTSSPIRSPYMGGEGVSYRMLPPQTASGSYDRYISVPHTSFPRELRDVHYESVRDRHAPAYEMVHSGRRPEPVRHAALEASRYQDGGEQRLRNSSAYETYRKL